ncbi:hypothetical protein B0A49_08135 [Cryomyces minteri]|uniref:Uncharacterized protein n=1 Tax=Cryomyces minteri TaxID=331657 RepID=A0A4U0WKL4_9PEZI|nr:hypothetical protein B0A49_08135 [Cryomyces minteri]
MVFDMDPTRGYSNAAVSLAHEFGHTFGLSHEHQRWSTWFPDSGTEPLLTPNCANLKNYDTFNDDKSKRDCEPTNNLCSSQQLASDLKFSTQDILPFKAFSHRFQSPAFDWVSIMLYPRTTGAKSIKGIPQYVLPKADSGKLEPSLMPPA